MPIPNDPDQGNNEPPKRLRREPASPFSPGALRAKDSPSGPPAGQKGAGASSPSGGGGSSAAAAPGAISQDQRHIAIDTKLGKDKVALRSFTATESISRLYQIEAELVSEDFKISFSDIIGTSATIRLETVQAKPRFFNGLVSCFRQAGNVGRLARYQAVIVPKLWFLTRSGDCRIFQKQTVPEIVKMVLREQGIDDIEDTLTEDYQPWEYCVQYRETDFNFVSRLMENEGIHYYFKHEKNSHTLVLADLGSVHTPFPGYSSAPYRGNERDLIELQSVRDWTLCREVETGVVELRDYDFKAPRKSLNGAGLTLGRSNAEADRTIFDYPGGYTEVDPGAHYARLRVDELQVGYENMYAQSDVRGIAAGRTFTLTDLPRADQNQEYLVVSTFIHAEGESFHTNSGGGGGSGGNEFSCSFQARSVKETFVPARLTPKPTIQGTQTAIVTGPKGEEIFTDDYGRIKVQFHWDRRGQHDENTTCFIRVAEAWAGRRWGSTFTPRIGQEVVVSFLEGDPDRPLIVGSVYNGDQMPPYLGDGPDPKHKKDPNVSGVKSCSTKGGDGYNEWRFDDTKGKEEVFIHAEKNMDTRVKANSMTNVGGNSNLIVGGEANGVKSGDQFEMVYKNKHLKIHNDHEEHIGGNMRLHVGGIDGPGNVDVTIEGTRWQTIKKDDSLHIAGERAQKVDGDQTRSVGGSMNDTVGKDYAVDVTKTIYFKSGTAFVLEATTEITVKCGSGFINIKADGTIAISGTKVLINSGGAAGSGEAPSAADPEDANTPAVPEPTAADDSKSGSISALSSSVPPPPKASPKSAAAAGAAAPASPSAPAIPGVPATPLPTLGFFNCVKNAAKKAGEAIDQGKKTVDDATKAVKAAVDGAHKVEDQAKAALKSAEKAVADAKSAVNSAGDTVDHLKKAASGSSVSEVKAAVKSGQDAVKKAQDAVKDAKDAVTKAKEAVDEAVADVKAAIKAAENFVDNVKETVKKTGDAIEAAGQCI